ncbi:MAG: 5'-methylthioadenosine/adenosylhomocysteine nucleosidase [Armatimonadota bacterium]
MKIGLIGPWEDEIMPFARKLEGQAIHRYAMRDFLTSEYMGVPVVAVVSGVGKVNAAIATQILIDRFTVTHVLLAGVAGALGHGLSVGDIVIAREVAHHDVSREVLTENHPWLANIYIPADNSMIEDCRRAASALMPKERFQIGRIITGEAFIQGQKRQRLVDAFAPLCVDMESASVAQTCYVNGIPFAVIRAMSDMACPAAAASFEENMTSVSLRALEIVEGFIACQSKHGMRQ